MYVCMYVCMHVCMYVHMHINVTCRYSKSTVLSFKGLQSIHHFVYISVGPTPSFKALAQTTDSYIMVTCAVPPQIQFVNVLTEWKVTLQREGGAITFVTSTFTAPSTQLTVNHLLPATRYMVWVSVKAGSAEGPLSNGLQVTTQEGGEP